MDAGERRTLDELLTIYELEETLRDVFVEGAWDKSLILQFLSSRQSEKGRIVAHAIDELEVSGDLVRSYGFTPSNRSEVIAICRWLFDKMGADFNRALGIIDADFDLLRNTPNPLPIILRSDYAAGELYLFNIRTLQKLLTVSFPKVPLSAGELINLLTPVLNRLFCIRLGADELKLLCEWPELRRFMNARGSSLTFEEGNFLRHYLASRQKTSMLPDLVKEVAKWSLELPAEPRIAIHGHDMIECLAIYLAQYYSKATDRERLRPNTLLCTYSCCLDEKELRLEPLFAQLIDRFCVTFQNN